MKFNLISPEKVIFSGDVEMILIPGSQGDFGVLDRHTPFMTSLREGLITIYNQETPQKIFKITGGFCEVNPQNCTVLADGIIEA